MKKKISPYLIILLSFVFVIIIGSILLYLPISLKEGINLTYLDSLLVATSSTTITGLTPVILIDTFSTFGKVVITILMQIGGLSITTLAFFIITMIGTKIGYKSRILVKENINVESLNGVIRMLRKIVILTLIIESIGVIIFTIIFLLDGQTFLNSLGHSIFHTVASYNNAGFDIFGANSLMNYSSNIVFNLVTVFLIVIGGIGSIVIFDILQKKNYKKLSFHSKIVLKMTGLLLLIGMLSVYILEPNISIIQAIFHSATLRTAGFYSYDYSTVKEATLLIMMLLMFIGAAPSSNGGGVKVTTIYTLFKSSTSYIREKQVIAYGRSIPNRIVKKAYTLVFFAVLIILTGTILISIIEPLASLTSIFFEVISAFSNTGLSLNLTPNLTSASKIIITIIMLIGRVGIITFMNTIIFKNNKMNNIKEYIDLEYII